MNGFHSFRRARPARTIALIVGSAAAVFASAQPKMSDPTLTVSAAVGGLDQPISMAFLGKDDFLVCEKATGRVKHVVNGAVVEVSLDLPVNSASERGLLCITLHPDFPVNPSVYLFHSKSTTGADSTDLAAVDLLGNRVDQFVWDGHNLTFVRNILELRSYQNDATNNRLRGNHNGGVIRFGPDRKLYAIVGDTGRRSWTQNNLAGPNPDDQFGGPFADLAHTTGVILRVGEDGAVPVDNPFVGKVSPNFDKVWEYGVRNSFGMAFDPVSGYLWTQENGDNSFDEVNRIEKGMNGGWIQAMGPIGRVQQFHDIEVAVNGLQQVRWPAFRLATVPSLAYRRMFHVPGSRYKDPLMSWKFPVAPAGIGFVHTSALGPDFTDTLIMGAARENMLGGYLMRFSLTPDRKDLSLSDPLLADRVADNAGRFDPKESESLIVGTDFGVGTDVQISPDGRVYVVSLSHGNVYEIKKK